MRLFQLMFLLLSVKLLTAQEIQTPDQLLQQARSADIDTVKARLLIAAAEKYLDAGQKNQMLNLLLEARALLNRTDNVPVRVNLYNLYATYYGIEINSEKRHLYADSMLSASLTGKYKYGEALGYLAKAAAFSMEKIPEESINYLGKAIAIFQELGDEAGMAKAYKLMGNNLIVFRKAAEAIPKYLIAAQKFNKLGKSLDEALVYGNISRAFAILNETDSGLTYINKAAAIAEKIPVEGELHFMVAMSTAEFKSKKNDYRSASAMLDKAFQIADKLKNNSMKGAALYIRANIAYNFKDYQAAIKYFKQAEDLHKATGNFSQWVDTKKEIAKTYYQTGDYKLAYDYLKEFYSINDSLFTANSGKQINELNIKYQTLEKEKKITEQELAITKKNTRLRTLIISLVAIGVALLLLFLFYVQRRKTYQQSLVTLKKEQDISLLKALMTGEEKERNRLARELHDGLGGILAAAQMQVSNLEIVDSSIQQSNKQKAAELVSKAATESRRIAHNLLPETLLRFGLNEALKEYSAAITESKLLDLAYESVGMEERMDAAAELSIYRVIQELINNIIKHAGATEALVQLHRHGSTLSVTVEDNGNGFSPADDKKEGIGLRNIQSRISYLNGSIDIRSEEKKGTSVYIEIQLDKNADA